MRWYFIYFPLELGHRRGADAFLGGDMWQVVGALISGTTNYDLQEEHRFVCYLFGAGGMRQVHTSFHTGVQEAQGAGKAELLLR